MTDEAITIMAKAIYEDRNGHGCKPWSRQGSTHKEPYLSDAKAAISAIHSAGYCIERRPSGLSSWDGWDRSGGSWSASCHQDSVCAAVFLDGYSAEDARTLLSFIDRTWGTPRVQTEAGGGSQDDDAAEIAIGQEAAAAEQAQAQ